MVEDTSRGITKIMSKEKYQARSTARVTRIGCCFQLAYLHKSAAAATNAIRRSQTNIELAMLPALS